MRPAAGRNKCGAVAIRQAGESGLATIQRVGELQQGVAALVGPAAPCSLSSEHGLPGRAGEPGREERGSLEW